MKKIKIIVMTFIAFILCACSSKNDDITNNFIKKVDNSKSYSVIGTMELKNKDDSYNYDVEVNYKYDSYYKVSLTNQSNGHKQIILKNDDGVYVVTPALNKSFNFQSKWPDNSSQSYLLKSIVSDIKNTKDINVNKKGDKYIVEADVDYPNNSSLKKEKIYFDKDSNLKKVSVLDKDENEIIIMTFNKIKYSERFKESNFKLESLVKVDNKEESSNNPNEEEKKEDTEESKETSILDSVVYPLYLPTNTHLDTKDTVEVDNGDRVIMTYTGGKPFMLIEEFSKPNKEMEVTSVYGDPLLLSSAVGALSENSLEWQSDNINYYISSSYLTSEEMMTIAESLSTKEVIEITNNK